MSGFGDMNAKKALQRSNRLFKDAQFEAAIESYGTLIKSEYLQSEGEETKEGGDGAKSGVDEDRVPGSVFGARHDILFDAHMNRSACYSMIGEWDLAIMDGLKCKEMNGMSIKMYARLATAYQGAGDHLVCMKECQKGLELRENDIALKEIWKKSDRVLHPENYSERGYAHVGSHDHSHDHSNTHSHDHSHAHTHTHTRTHGSPNVIPRMGSYESDFDKDEFGGVGVDGHKARKTPEGNKSCWHDANIACCFP